MLKNKTEFLARLNSLAPDTLIVSRTTVNDQVGCMRGTIADLSVGAGKPGVAPEGEPDLHYNFVSLDGDYLEMREVWIAQTSVALDAFPDDIVIGGKGGGPVMLAADDVPDMAPGWEDRAVERAKNDGVLR